MPFANAVISNRKKAKLFAAISPLKRGSKGTMLIDKGLFEYGYFNACFLENMMSLMVYALAKGYTPYLKLKDRKEGWSDWDTFFEQPFSVPETEPDCICDVEQGFFHPQFDTPYRSSDLRLWCKVYHRLVRLNERTRNYVDQEYQELFEGVDGQKHRTLGVICRGTDYVKLKPMGHPVQPTPEQVIARAKVLLDQYQLERVYLATEEYAIYEKFEKAFPGLILVNKRQYYDEVFNNHDMTYVYEVQFDREDDLYLKGLEYLSSLQLLSRCNVLLGGNCGGACAALYMNNRKYEHVELFNLGLYP